MNIKNRITGSGMCPVEAIKENPVNWRLHPKYQADILSAVLDEVGWVQQVIVNSTTGNLIDGHLRLDLAKRNGETEIPAVFVELSDEEERKILTVIDPIAAQAETNQAQLNDLVESIKTDNEELNHFLDKLRKETEKGTDEVLVKRSIQLHPKQEYLLVICPTEDEFIELRNLLGLGMVRRGGYKEGSPFDMTGPERVFLAERLIERLKNADSRTE